MLELGDHLQKYSHVLAQMGAFDAADVERAPGRDGDRVEEPAQARQPLLCDARRGEAALQIPRRALRALVMRDPQAGRADDRSEEHTSELQSLMRISYAVFCLKKKNNYNQLLHSTKLFYNM